MAPTPPQPFGEEATLTATGARGRPALDTTGASPVPRSIGRFIVVDELGRGGMGVVYSAFDPELERNVAIKLISAHKSDLVDYRERFVREAKAMARLSHPHVVQVYDVGLSEGSPWIAMEFIEGVTLAEWLDAHPDATVAQVVELFHRAGRGLAAAHAAGLVHRDFKPANVMVAPGRVVVLDFGVAAELESSRAAEGSRELPDVAGTPAYMSPEQLAGKHADPRTDQFSFCVALYEAVAKVPPYPRAPFGVRMDAIDGGKLEPPKRALPKRVRAALERGLSANPDERWPSMADLLRQLERPRRGWLAWPLGAAIAAGGWVLAQQGRVDPCNGIATRVQEVWNDEVRDAIEQAVLATGSPEAEHTAGLLIGELDDYTHAWSETATTSCNAAHHDHDKEVAEHERTMTCLTSSLHQLEASLGVAATNGSGRLNPFTTLMDPIPSPERCDATTQLPILWNLFDDDTTAIERAKAATRFGDPRRALEALAPYLEEGADYEPLQRARATLAAADAHESLAELDQADTLARHAATLSMRLGDAEGFARSAALLCRMAGREGDYTDATTWGELGLAMIEATQFIDARGSLLNELASANQLQYRPDVAEGYYKGFLELSIERHGEGSRYLVAPLGNLGSNALMLGDHEGARDYLERGLEIAEHELAPNARVTLTLRSSLAAVHASAGDYPLAWDAARAVVADMEKHLPPHDLSLASPLSVVADIAAERGDYETARRTLERTRTIFRKQRSALQETAIESQLGSLARLTGDHDEARAILQRTEARTVELLGEDNYILGELYMYRGENELDAGKLDAAQTLIERARPILLEGSVGFEAQRCLADILEGRIALARGDRGPAITLLRRAVRCADEYDQNVSLPPMARLHLAKALLTPATGLDTADPVQVTPRELLEEATKLVQPMGDIKLARDIATTLASAP